MSDSFQFPWDTDPVPPPLLSESGPPKPKPRGRRPASATRAIAQATRTAPDWLYHHVTISGPADQVAGFAAAARGAGIIPWQLDFAAIEEDVFIRAVSQPASQRNLSVAGCRILARQFRERVEARQGRAAALVGQSLACPFDLQALLPVPPTILPLGPTHPGALAWLAAHWGMTEGLRQVVLRDKATTGRRRPRDHTVIGYGFFTAGDTPHAAMDAIAPRWPALRFSLVPRPAD